MKSVLITGGAGFIGKHLCRHLCSQGYNVTIYDNFSTSSNEELKEEAACIENLKIISADIIDLEMLLWVFQETKPDIVVHLAAIVSVQESIDNPGKIKAVNIDGTINVLKASQKSGVQKIIFASSAAVYGAIKPPLSENMVVVSNYQYENLLSPYAVSKLRGEEEILKSKINSTIFRIFNVYGKGQKKSGGYAAVIPEFISCIKGGKDVEIFGDGEQTRDFIAVEDVARAIKLSIENPQVSGIFNLASGRGVSLTYLISVIEKILSKKINISYKPARVGDIKYSFADIGQIRQKLDFSAEIPLEVGIKKLIEL